MSALAASPAFAFRCSAGVQSMVLRVQRLTADRGDIQGAILSIAAESNMGLLVMGGYGHSRLQERILGGVTRSMFESMVEPHRPVPTMNVGTLTASSHFICAVAQHLPDVGRRRMVKPCDTTVT